MKEISLNVEQLQIYESIINSTMSTSTAKVFFIDGPGGTGKTYLQNLILNKIRSSGEIAVAVASSGIAALLLQKGRTAHSRFKIPLSPSSSSVCSIRRQSPLADMLRTAKLILWDEAPMMHKFAFEAVDRMLRDIRSCDDIFGGITFVMCGDFRQILPVVPKGLRPDIVAATIKESYIWHSVNFHRLLRNMRTLSHETHHALGDMTFADWLLALGEDRLQRDDLGYILCPSSMLLPQRTLLQLINAVYPDINREGVGTYQYFKVRAILAARNQDVSQINNTILSFAPGQNRVYFSADTVEDCDGRAFITSEYLNTLDISGWPPHKLLLKIGAPVMLLRNIDPFNGLCNGTRLLVRHLSDRVIEAEVITGEAAGYIAFIPRISLLSDTSGLPYTIRRKQFPLRLAYAMTINKAQGQSLESVGLCLTRDVFSHGQLYVALSRAISVEKIFVLLECSSSSFTNNLIRNVVYTEVLN